MNVLSFSIKQKTLSKLFTMKGFKFVLVPTGNRSILRIEDLYSRGLRKIKIKRAKDLIILIVTNYYFETLTRSKS
jgi:hypothetical protein